MVTAENPEPPNFSKTLLKVLISHCARFLNHDIYQRQYQTQPSHDVPVPVPLTSSEFMKKATHEARLGLGLDTLKKSSIPTIQALLQQSAREIAFGRSSQGRSGHLVCLTSQLTLARMALLRNGISHGLGHGHTSA